MVNYRTLIRACVLIVRPACTTTRSQTDATSVQRVSSASLEQALPPVLAKEHANVPQDFSRQPASESDATSMITPLRQRSLLPRNSAMHAAALDVSLRARVISSRLQRAGASTNNERERTVWWLLQFSHANIAMLALAVQLTCRHRHSRNHAAPVSQASRVTLGLKTKPGSTALEAPLATSGTAGQCVVCAQSTTNRIPTAHALPAVSLHGD